MPRWVRSGKDLSIVLHEGLITCAPETTIFTEFAATCHQLDSKVRATALPPSIEPNQLTLPKPSTGFGSPFYQPYHHPARTHIAQLWH